jgi:alkaline phosphatase D
MHDRFPVPATGRAGRHSKGLSRRAILQTAPALATLPLLGRASWAIARPVFEADPFSLGVASGDPDASSVVLWTRLAPRPLDPDGGMPPEAVAVWWELADDEGFHRIVASGTTHATPQLGHSVHVEPAGLSPDRWYFYRFGCGDAVSPVGRTRTFPAADVLASGLRFAVTSCQNYEQGLYTAYEQMARDDLDLVCHLGDYIYEYEAGRNGKVRTHAGPEIMSLGDYRVRHAQYRSDPLLHRMHAACPWLVTWDDHEFDNNCAGAISEEAGVDPAAFLERRANAYQAYYEAMPLRAACLPRGSDMTLYRHHGFGRLAEFLVLDTRQYRTDQPNGDRNTPPNDAARDPGQTMLGREQRGWLQQRLVTSPAAWNVLAQQVMMAAVRLGPEGREPGCSMDQWPGYLAERDALLRFMAGRRVSNPVVLTGDIHSAWANDLRIDDLSADSPVVASEFVATSLSSGGNGPEKPAGLERILSTNPGVRFHNGERGYIRCAVTPREWRSDFMVVDDVLAPGGRTFPRASFVIESGDPRIRPA